LAKDITLHGEIGWIPEKIPSLGYVVVFGFSLPEQKDVDAGVLIGYSVMFSWREDE
jgi:hypothetical protein